MRERLRTLFFASVVLGIVYACSIVFTAPKQTFTFINYDTQGQAETVAATGKTETHTVAIIRNITKPSNTSQRTLLENVSKKEGTTAPSKTKAKMTTTSTPTARSLTKTTMTKTATLTTSAIPSNSSLATEGTNETGLCPKTPPGLKGVINPSSEILPWDVQEKKHPELTIGGFYKPTSCMARYKVAILIPYRARKEHLHIFTNTMHDFLQKQQLDYGIYIIEQNGDAEFNRALLFNIGYREAMKDQHWDCLVFHDVDNIPLNDKNLYHCAERPRHLSVAVQRMNFRLPYNGYFGGVSMMSTSHFEKINGMSNKYWGWGGEDDDLYYRMKVLSQWAARQAKDGLSDLKYKMIKKEYRRLFTYILADLTLMQEKKKA